MVCDGGAVKVSKQERTEPTILAILLMLHIGRNGGDIYAENSPHWPLHYAEASGPPQILPTQLRAK